MFSDVTALIGWQERQTVNELAVQYAIWAGILVIFDCLLPLRTAAFKMLIRVIRVEAIHTRRAARKGVCTHLSVPVDSLKLDREPENALHLFAVCHSSRSRSDKRARKKKPKKKTVDRHRQSNLFVRLTLHFALSPTFQSGNCRSANFACQRDFCL
jgi:hypothetical protein